MKSNWEAFNLETSSVWLYAEGKRITRNVYIQEELTVGKTKMQSNDINNVRRCLQGDEFSES